MNTVKVNSNTVPVSHGFTLPKLPDGPLLSSQIPTLGQYLSKIEQAKESYLAIVLLAHGMDITRPEEIRKRCVIVVEQQSRTERLHIDGVVCLEWGYLDHPHTWTIRTVGQGDQK